MDTNDNLYSLSFISHEDRVGHMLDDYFDGGLKSFLSLMNNIYVYLVALLSTIALIILGMF